MENINTVTRGSNRMTLKHWATFKALYVASESGYVGSTSVLGTSPAGDSCSITRVEMVDLPDTCGGAVDGAGTVQADSTH